MSNAAPGSARHAAIPRTSHSAVAGGGTRQCARCFALLAQDSFYKRAAGLRGECKACTKSVSASNRKARKRHTVAHGGHAGKATHCKRGHEFTPANTIIARSGKRQCRACKKLVSSAKLAKHPDLADKPVVTRKAFRVVVDPIAAAIFGGGK